MTFSPCLIRSSTSAGEARFALDHPLVDRDLGCVAGRAGPDPVRAVTFDVKTFLAVDARIRARWWRPRCSRSSRTGAAAVRWSARRMRVWALGAPGRAVPTCRRRRSARRSAGWEHPSPPGPPEANGAAPAQEPEHDEGGDHCGADHGPAPVGGDTNLHAVHQDEAHGAVEGADHAAPLAAAARGASRLQGSR